MYLMICTLFCSLDAWFHEIWGAGQPGWKNEAWGIKLALLLDRSTSSLFNVHAESLTLDTLKDHSSRNSIYTIRTGPSLWHLSAFEELWYKVNKPALPPKPKQVLSPGIRALHYHQILLVPQRSSWWGFDWDLNQLNHSSVISSQKTVWATINTELQECLPLLHWHTPPHPQLFNFLAPFKCE